MKDDGIKASVMIYVQHLLGIGHLRRSWSLACALADHNIPVVLVSGGRPVAGLQHDAVRLLQLPSVHCRDGRFDQLLDEQGLPVDKDWKEYRRDQLLDLYHSIKPEVLITETFPFGRRMMRFELLPLLTAAKQASNAPLIIASIRDILQPKSKPERNEEILDWIKSFYDRVLIHGDPALIKLELTFPFAKQVRNKLHYTGYICNPNLNSPYTESDHGHDEVIVSGGGGAASLKLLETAIAARSLSKLHSRVWRILVGNNLSPEVFEKLQQKAGSTIIVERNRNDFPELLGRCAVSVSQAGYNTVIDILQQAARAVLVPFAEDGELEQSLRADQLMQMGRVVTLTEIDMTPQQLADAIDNAATMTIADIDINLQGLTNSVKHISGWLDERP